MKRSRLVGTTPILSPREKLIQSIVSEMKGQKINGPEIARRVSIAEGGTSVRLSDITVSISRINQKAGYEIIGRPKSSGRPRKEVGGYFDPLATYE